MSIQYKRILNELSQDELSQGELSQREYYQDEQTTSCHPLSILQNLHEDSRERSSYCRRAKVQP